jgi:hypothetical protein
MAEKTYARSGYTMNLGKDARHGGALDDEPGAWQPLLRVCPEGTKPIGRFRHRPGGGIDWECDGELEGYLLSRHQTGTFALGKAEADPPKADPPKADHDAGPAKAADGKAGG